VSKGIDRMAGAEREVVGQRDTATGKNKETNWCVVTAPATEAAIQWQGWGTALKPAWEPIVLARKPLSESSIAANVLKHGTGGINVDGCRVETADAWSPSTRQPNDSIGTFKTKERTTEQHSNGRWPANLIHDGSEEVLAGFPESSVTGNRTDRSKAASVNGTNWLSDNHQSTEHLDSGSAARFFYTAKADADDRLGSKHPTVKPIDLMQYLIRLVTPKGGIVLDPFGGTGTTGEASWREGCLAVIIEREEEYQADIVKRMGLCLSGPEERRAASVKQLPPDDLPMFGGGI
jgi:hypothetical protein